MERDDRHFTIGYPLGFLARAAGLSAVACGLGLWLLRWFFSRDLGSEFAPAFYLLRHLVGFLLPALAFSLLSVLLVACCALFGVALFASHKIAGPLFRLQRVAGYLCRGILVGRVHLRTGDQGRPLAETINVWVQARKDLLQRNRALAERLDELLCACEAGVAAGDREDTRRAAKELEKKASELGANWPTKP
jgi:hypothetical protein